MKQTFEELTKKYSFQDNREVLMYEKECINLMKLVRLRTLEECSNKAEADYSYQDEICVDGEYGFTGIEVYVLKESILQLDKNSIEI